MAQIFEEGGNFVPVTYVVCEPNTICQVKTQEKDGFDAVVLGGEKLNKPRKTKKFRAISQFHGGSDLKAGDEITADIFADGEKVTITSVSKGKGFQGQVRRHNFTVARKTHGTKDPRHGSTGACAMPGRTKPGLKMAGRMGSDRVTLHDRIVVKVDASRNLIAIKGPIPGAKNSIVYLKKQA